jgi:DNA-binding transcriptional ArsR family regulator
MTTPAGFAPIADAFGNPARETIVAALIGGSALPTGELATAAGLSPSGASAHLQKLRDAGILEVITQGRFRYYRIADEEVGRALEALANIADRARTPYLRRSRCPDVLRFARSCYSHLAGRLGVALADTLESQQLVTTTNATAVMTTAGEHWLRDLGIAVSSRGPLLRPCNDWTERRRHFAGPIASAILRRLLELKYLERRSDKRALYQTPAGQVWLQRLGIDLMALQLDR